MADKTKELLAVLDLPEEEQLKKLAYYIQPKPWFHFMDDNATADIDLERPDEETLIGKCDKCGQKFTGWVGWRTGHGRSCSVPNPITESLADLAFRLRDEVTAEMPLVPTMPDKDNVWYKAVRIVVDKILEDDAQCDILEELGWLANFGEPIHWIIAALIAKELTNEQ